MEKKTSIPIVILLILALCDLVLAQDSIKIFRYPEVNKMNVIVKTIIEKKCLLKNSER